jgi:hypothetical protein
MCALNVGFGATMLHGDSKWPNCNFFLGCILLKFYDIGSKRMSVRMRYLWNCTECGEV